MRGRVKRFSSDIWFRMGCGRCGAEGAFLGKLLRRSRVKKVLSGGCVSRQIFGLGWGGEGAGQSFRFCLGLERKTFLQVLSRVDVSSRVCTSTKFAFFILPFSLERKRKKQGEPTNGSPLPPFQRSTGQSKDGKARKKIPGAGGVIQCKSPGRTGQRAQPAPSR